MSERVEIEVPEGVEKMRADKFLSEQIGSLSRTLIQKAFKSGDVTLDGVVIGQKTHISEGGVLKIIFPEVAKTSVKPVDISLDILYEDDDIIAVNKVSGMVTHPGKGTSENTLVHALLNHCKGQLAAQAGAIRPGVVHRLDKETSGVILFAKSDQAYQVLTRMFAERELDKQYLALVKRVPRLKAGTIKEAIARDPRHRTRMEVNAKGRPSHTDWVLEEAFGSAAALLRCQLHTGRTHQIRVHLAFIKHAIFGDKIYGYRHDDNLLLPRRIYLHAAEIKLKHPVSGKDLHFKTELPASFNDYLVALRNQ